MTLEYESISNQQPPVRLWRGFVVPFLCLASAWLVGAVTNAISGLVNRQYFNAIVGRWYGGSMSLADCAYQGLWESTFFGIAFAVLFTIVYVATTLTRCPLRFVCRTLGIVLLIVFGCWGIGGAIGYAYASMSPLEFQGLFPLSGATSGSGLSRWGFVGGSIWGVYAGGLLSIFVACLVLPLCWHHRWNLDASRHRFRT